MGSNRDSSLESALAKLLRSLVGPDDAAPPRPRPRTRRKRIPAQLKREIFERDDYKCHYCRFPSSPDRASGELDIEHKNPQIRGGSDTKRNLVTSCNGCNNQKGSKTAAQYKAWRKANPAKANITPHQRGGQDPLKTLDHWSRVDLWTAIKKFLG